MQGDLGRIYLLPGCSACRAFYAVFPDFAVDFFGRPRRRPFPLTDLFFEPGGQPLRLAGEATTVAGLRPRRGARDPASSSAMWVAHRSFTRLRPPTLKVTL